MLVWLPSQWYDEMHFLCLKLRFLLSHITFLPFVIAMLFNLCYISRQTREGWITSPPVLVKIIHMCRHATFRFESIPINYCFNYWFSQFFDILLFLLKNFILSSMNQSCTSWPYSTTYIFSISFNPKCFDSNIFVTESGNPSYVSPIKQ